MDGFDVSVRFRPHARSPRYTAVWSIGPVSPRTVEVPASTKKPRRWQKRRGTTPNQKEDAQMNLKADQKVALAVSFKDRAGNVLSPEQVGSLTFASSDESLVTVTDNGDGTAVATTTGTLGEAVVTATNDFDEDGTADFSGSLAVSVVAGDVFEIALSAGEPVSRFEEDVPPVEPDPDAPVE
jgi:hypothetical protein